jgi:hypothetical protein
MSHDTIYKNDEMVAALSRLCLAKTLAVREINSLHSFLAPSFCYHSCPCAPSSGSGLEHLTVVCSSRNLPLEILAVRQEFFGLERKHPKPKLNPLDKLFWCSLAGSGPLGSRLPWWLP